MGAQAPEEAPVAAPVVAPSAVPNLFCHLADSPRTRGQACALAVPFANPVYLSDSPRFLHRQRARAASALVSEHIGSHTCPCQKCVEAAQALAIHAWNAGDAGTCSAITGCGAAKSSTAVVQEAKDATDGATAAEKRRLSSRPTNPGDTVAIAAHSAWGREAGACPEQGPGRGDGGVTGGGAPVGEERDFVWLLKVVAAATRGNLGGGAAVEGGVDGGGIGAKGARRDAMPLGSVLATGGGTSLLANLALNLRHTSLQGRLGVKIPDTVILEKGKPRKRYTVNSLGQLQVTEPKTSADLLRVLREFVKKATLQYLLAALPVSEARARQLLDKASGKLEAAFDIYFAQEARAAAQRPGNTATSDRRRASSDVTLKGSKSDSALLKDKVLPSPLARSGNSGALVRSGKSSASIAGSDLHVPSPSTREVAVLHYSDFHRTVRLMSQTEAEAQMKEPNGTPASKLPRDFWQDVRILQAPVRSSVLGSSARYITYSFDARSQEPEPQAPVPLVHRRSMSVPHVDHRGGTEASRVAIVPRKLNQLLASGTRASVLELVSGQFEFVLDEADGTLWLVNASRLVCRRCEKREEVQPAPTEEYRYFEEDEFYRNLREQEERFAVLKNRFKRPIVSKEGGDPIATGAAAQATSAADRLAGMKMPDELAKYYEAGDWMMDFFENKVKNYGMDVGFRTGQGIRAVGLGVWFRRWARASRTAASTAPVRRKPRGLSAGGQSDARRQLQRPDESPRGGAAVAESAELRRSAGRLPRPLTR